MNDIINDINRRFCKRFVFVKDPDGNYLYEGNKRFIKLPCTDYLFLSTDPLCLKEKIISCLTSEFKIPCCYKKKSRKHHKRHHKKHHKRHHSH